ncbi:hypothetical protein LG634_26375 [Streptomyces bambusae]|uniref:hypothetical protein n=1 Tax=Streptomyces bambusae TaxID=1550616 RepID=UPI001CFCAFAD|nr:hypothetical protein [Streptomyces bambusae]MCB5168339.1 hypothetical protein [Streptomyces bambusae]
MESDFSPQQALAVAERGATAPWTDYPRTPAWYYPAGGLWAAGLVLALTELHGPALAGALAALVALELAFALWYRKVRTAWPKLSAAPAEFRPALRAFVLGTGALAAVVTALALFVGAVAAVPVTLVGVTAGLYAYEKAYERAAARTRSRVGGAA